MQKHHGVSLPLATDSHQYWDPISGIQSLQLNPSSFPCTATIRPKSIDSIHMQKPISVHSQSIVLHFLSTELNSNTIYNTTSNLSPNSIVSIQLKWSPSSPLNQSLVLSEFRPTDVTNVNRSCFTHKREFLLLIRNEKCGWEFSTSPLICLGQHPLVALCVSQQGIKPIANTSSLEVPEWV